MARLEVRRGASTDEGTKMTEHSAFSGVAASPFDAWLADDAEVAGLLRAEAERQSTTLQLIASENFTSLAVLAATGSVLTNKYSEGYPGRRYYGGNRVIDEVEELARERAKALFGAEHANVQPHAGANANLAVYQALLQPGDTVLAMRLDQGGHLTHGSPASITSKIWRFVGYGVTPASDDPDRPGEVIDFDEVADVAKRERPKLIVAGATAYPRVIDPEPFREIADAVGARLMFDIAHPAGLVAGGAHPNPVGVADVVTFTTHKTLRGPRGGAIVCRAELAKAIDSAVFPGLQGGPLEHVIAAKAVAFREAAQPSFRQYAAAVVANARALGEALAREGFRLVSGGTDSHLLLIDLRSFDESLTGKEAQEVLDRSGITLNRNTIPDDPRSPFVTSGLRLGTAAETTAGMGVDEMAEIASLMGTALRGRTHEDELANVRASVRALCDRFPPYPALSGPGGGTGPGGRGD
jgi:glycine hydroxymethyltransferase